MRASLIRAAAAVLAVPAVLGCGPSEAKKTLCASNLRMLWTAQYLLPKKEGGKFVHSSAVGRAFWTGLQADLAAHGKPLDAETLVCPLSGKTGGKGVTTYRGPKADVNTLAAEATVGACALIHSDGSLSVLLKDGSVHVVSPGDPLHARGTAETSP